MKDSINDCINDRDKAKESVTKLGGKMLNAMNLLGNNGENMTFIDYMMKKESEAFMRYDVCNELVSYKSNAVANKYKKIMAFIGITGVADSIGILFVMFLMGSPLFLSLAGAFFGFSVVMELITIAFMKGRLGSEFIAVSKRFYNKAKLKVLGTTIKASLFLRKNKSKEKVKGVYETLYKMQCLKNRYTSLMFKSNDIISVYSNSEFGGRYDTEEEVKYHTGYDEFKENKMIKEFSGKDAKIEKRAKMDIYEAVGELRIMMDDFTIEEKGEFYPELNDIVSRYNNYMASSKRDIKVKVDIARDIDILRNRVNNMVKAKTSVKKRVLGRE